MTDKKISELIIASVLPDNSLIPIANGTNNFSIPSTSILRPEKLLSEFDTEIKKQTVRENIGVYGITESFSQTQVTTLLDEKAIKQKNDPNGFWNASTEISLSWNETTRTLTVNKIGAEFSFFIRGDKYTKTVSETITIPNTTGSYFIYYDLVSGVPTLQYQTSFSSDLILQKCYVAFVYWNSTQSISVPDLQIETHGSSMSGDDHLYNHTTTGTAFVSGLALSLDTTGTGSTDNQARFIGASGVIADEDLQHTITAKNITDNFPIIYRVGNEWRANKTSNFVTIKGTNLPYYNQNNAGTWQLTEMTNNKYGVIYIFASPGLTNKWFILMGQNQYDNVNSATNAAKLYPDLGNLPLQEFKLVGSAIFQASNSFPNTSKSALQKLSSGVDYYDWRKTSIAGQEASILSSDIVNLSNQINTVNTTLTDQINTVNTTLGTQISGLDNSKADKLTTITATNGLNISSGGTLGQNTNITGIDATISNKGVVQLSNNEGNSEVLAITQKGLDNFLNGTNLKEKTEDIISNLIQDTTSIKKTYDDLNNQITFNLAKSQNSLTVDLTDDITINGGIKAEVKDNSITNSKIKSTADIETSKIKQITINPNTNTPTNNSTQEQLNNSFAGNIANRIPKVPTATVNNFAIFDLNGNVVDSLKNASSFEPADATILKEAEVVNNLTSTATNLPLSANQGKVLQDNKLNITDAPATAITAVGGVLTDTNSIDFVYTASPQKIEANIRTTNSSKISITTVPNGIQGNIVADSLVNADINNNANIAASKIQSGTLASNTNDIANNDLLSDVINKTSSLLPIFNNTAGKYLSANKTWSDLNQNAVGISSDIRRDASDNIVLSDQASTDLGTQTDLTVRLGNTRTSSTKGGNLILQPSNGTAGSGDVAIQVAPNSIPPIDIDTKTNYSNVNIQNASFSHTVNSGKTNRLLLLFITYPATVSVTSVTYGGVAMSTLLTTTSVDVKLQTYYLINPTVGTANIVINRNATNSIAATAINFSNINQSTPISGNVGTWSNSQVTSALLNISSGQNKIPISAISTINALVTIPSDQSQLSINVTGAQEVLSSSYKISNLTNTSLSYNFPLSTFAMQAFALNPIANNSLGTMQNTAVFNAQGVNGNFVKKTSVYDTAQNLVLTEDQAQNLIFTNLVGANSTIKLPNATRMSVGTTYVITNNNISTVTVSSSDDVVLGTITGVNKQISFVLTNNLNTAGTWIIDPIISRGNVSDLEFSTLDGISTASTIQSQIDGKLSISLKGVANGLAELGSDGKVPAAQLPAAVDEILEYSNISLFPPIGETNKIYLALDTNIMYRWSGSQYIEISSSLALGETSSTAYRGDRGKIAYDHSQTSGNPHNTTKADIGLGNVDNTSDLNKPISIATQTALNDKFGKTTNNEFNVLTAKAKIVDGDVLPIEDSAASFSKKKSSLSTISSYVYSKASSKKIIYLSPTGLDTNSGFSQETAVLTLTKALELAGNAGNQIEVLPGTYPGDYTITEQNISIVGSNNETRGICNFTGTLTLNNTAASSQSLTGLSLATVNNTGNGGVYIENCTINTALSNSTSGYMQVERCDMGAAPINITGAGNKNFLACNGGIYTINNASAILNVKDCLTVVFPTLTSGILAISNAIIYSIINGDFAINTSSGSILYLSNCSIINEDKTPAKINIRTGSFYSFCNINYDRANSTLNGTNLNREFNFDNIRANIINGISNTALQYISTLSSDAQTQLNNKQPLANNLTNLANMAQPTGADSNKFISVNSSGSFQLGTASGNGNVSATGLTGVTGKLAMFQNGTGTLIADPSNATAEQRQANARLLKLPGIFTTTEVASLTWLENDIIYNSTANKLLRYTSSATWVDANANIGDYKDVIDTTQAWGWRNCNSQEISRTSYPEAFVLLGVQFGEGNGTTTFNLPDFRGKVTGYTGTGTFTETFLPTAINTSTDIITVSSGNALENGVAVVMTTTGTLPQGITAGTTYYVIKVTATTIKLATSLTNVQNANGINFVTTGSGVGTGVHKLTTTLTTRSLGNKAGEEETILTPDEMPPHTHGLYGDSGSGIGGNASTDRVLLNDDGASKNNYVKETASTGGNLKHNNMQPTLFGATKQIFLGR